jgi:hypothetical protein
MKSKTLYFSFAALIVVIIAGGLWYVNYNRSAERPSPSDSANSSGSPRSAASDNSRIIKLYQVTSNGIVEKQHTMQSETSSIKLAEGIVNEYLKTLPQGAEELKLLGIFRDREDIYYVDLPAAFRSQLAGSDAALEHSILKALVLSLTTNIPSVRDVRILIDGKEVSSLGGHISLLLPLRALADQTVLSPQDQ